MNNYEELNAKKEELLKTPVITSEDFANKLQCFQNILKEFQEKETNNFISQVIGKSDTTEINNDFLAQITGHNQPATELLNKYSEILKQNQ